MSVLHIDNMIIDLSDFEQDDLENLRFELITALMIVEGRLEEYD